MRLLLRVHARMHQRAHVCARTRCAEYASILPCVRITIALHQCVDCLVPLCVSVCLSLCGFVCVCARACVHVAPGRGVGGGWEQSEQATNSRRCMPQTLKPWVSLCATPNLNPQTYTAS